MSALYTAIEHTFGSYSVLVRFGVLGSVQIDGEPIGGPRQRALLALLLLDAGRIVTFTRLLDGMYGNEPPAGATSALQSQISRLRRGLPDGLIEFHPAGYRIAVDPEDVDVHRFEQLARQGTRALAEGDHPRAVTLLTEALGLWRGPALADAPLAAEAVKARLAELELGAREDLFDAQLALGAAEIPELRAHVQKYPLRERPRGQLMLALSGSGRPAEALAEFENARRTLAEQLGADPSPELAAIHLAVLRGEPDPRAGVPAQLTTFFGRASELARIAELLADTRLVTITGPGGAGKTRLAIEIAGQQARETCFVDLAALTHGTDIPQAVLAALGVRDTTLFGTQAHDAAARVVAALADRHVLLIMDNCEHVIAEAAQLTRDLLGACPGLRVLATSREALGITGEYLCPLPSLPTEAAVALFADRAAAVAPGFRVNPENADTVREICTALDGMPLAIELAAARLRALDIADIAVRLNDRFTLLSRGDRTAAPRHRTLRAAVEWSWGLLDPEEQLLAARLTVFVGGATIKAIEQVCEIRADVLTSLVDKSFVESVGGRYRMLDTIRAFCAEQLTESRAAQHANYFYHLVESATPHLRRAEQLEWLSRLDAEHGNIQAALHWAIANDTTLALRMFSACSLPWYLRGLVGQAQPLAVELLDRIGAQPPDELDKLDEEYVICVMHATWGQIDAPEWHDHLKQAEVIMRSPRGALRRTHSTFLWHVVTGPPKGEPQRPLRDNDTWSTAFGTLGSALLHYFDGEIAAADRELAAALAGFRAVGDRWGQVATLDTLAQLADFRGDRDFVDLLTEAMDLVGQLGSIDDTVTLLCRRADNLVRGGELDAAGADYEHAATLARRIGVADQLSAAYSGLGDIARFRGDLVNARRLQELALSKCGTGPFSQGGARARVLIALGRLAEDDGDFEGARSLYDQAVSVAREHRHLPLVARAADGLASVALHDGDPQRAALLLGAGVALRGVPLAGDPDIARVTTEAKAMTSANAFDAAYEEGAALTRQAALALLGQRSVRDR